MNRANLQGQEVARAIGQPALAYNDLVNGAGYDGGAEGEVHQRDIGRAPACFRCLVAETTHTKNPSEAERLVLCGGA
ncbi:hypothetical protein ACVWW1_000535 [Bradyrhizobium sp. JR3.5]